jgi:hypothetical protein
MGVIKSSVLKPKPKNFLLIYWGIEVEKLKNLPQQFFNFLIFKNYFKNKKFR